MVVVVESHAILFLVNTIYKTLKGFNGDSRQLQAHYRACTINIFDSELRITSMHLYMYDFTAISYS